MVVGPPLGCSVCPRMRTPPSVTAPWEGFPRLWPDRSQQSELTSCCLRSTPLLSGDQRTKEEFAPVLSQDWHPFLLPIGVENSPNRTRVQSSGGDSSSPFLLLVGFYPLPLSFLFLLHYCFWSPLIADAQSRAQKSRCHLIGTISWDTETIILIVGLTLPSRCYFTVNMDQFQSFALRTHDIYPPPTH